MKFLKKNKKKILIVLGTIVLLILLSGIFKPKKKIESSIVSRGNVQETLTLSGEIDSSQKASLAFQAGGKLAWVGGQEGAYVYKGQSLASLDIRALKIGLNKSLNIYQITRNDFEQANFDNKDWSTNPDSDYRTRVNRILDKYQLTLNNSVLDVEATNLQIELSSISAPISGILTKVVNPVAGVNVSPMQVQFEIVNPDTLFLSVAADQSDIPNIKIGQQADIVLDAYPDEKLKGEVSKIAFVPKAGETGTVYEVKIALTDFKNKDQRYRLGMTADATFVLKEAKDTFFVEPQFVKSDKEGKYIVVENGKKRISIQTGIESDSKVEIMGDIAIGVKVYSLDLSK